MHTEYIRSLSVENSSRVVSLCEKKQKTPDTYLFIDTRGELEVLGQI